MYVFWHGIENGAKKRLYFGMVYSAVQRVLNLRFLQFDRWKIDCMQAV